MREYIDKIKDHFGPMQKPSIETMELDAKKLFQTQVYDMLIIFPDYRTCSIHKWEQYMISLADANKERITEYLNRIEDTDPELYDMLDGIGAIK